MCSVVQLYPAPCDPMDCSSPGSSVHGIFQARILEWVAIPFSRRSSWPRDQTQVSGISCLGRRIPYHWVIWEANDIHDKPKNIWAPTACQTPPRVGFPGGSVSKESAYNAGDPGLIPGSGRSPGGRDGNLLQYSCQENHMDRGAWSATNHGVAAVRHWQGIKHHPPLSLSSYVSNQLYEMDLHFNKGGKKRLLRG